MSELSTKYEEEQTRLFKKTSSLEHLIKQHEKEILKLRLNESSLIEMVKEPKSRKTDSLVSFKEETHSKSIQVNTMNLP